MERELELDSNVDFPVCCLVTFGKSLHLPEPHFPHGRQV